MKAIISPLGLILAVTLLVNCNRARLEPNKPGMDPAQTEHIPRGGANGSAPPAVVCKAAIVKAANNVKVLFVVDGSGSNFGANGSQPSDPSKEWRTNTLRQFITENVNKPNFFYGLTLFQGVTSVAKIKVNGVPGFSNDRAVVSEGFRSFLRTRDGGNTPYKAALKMAKEIIAADLEQHLNDNTTYAVVMVSDGHATDYKKAHDVIPDAASIKDLAPERITLNSVYYSARKVDASAPQYLKSIANIGEGAFIVANTKQSLKLADVVHFSALSCR